MNWPASKSLREIPGERRTRSEARPYDGAELQRLESLHHASPLAESSLVRRLIATIREREADIARLHGGLHDLRERTALLAHSVSRELGAVTVSSVDDPGTDGTGSGSAGEP